LERKTTKVRLKINEQKTKFMIATGNDRTIRDVEQSVAIGDKHFEIVKKCVYLGSLVTPTNVVSLGIHRKHLQSNHLPRQTKFNIHKTLIRAVLRET
jgi:hypothetical protein